MRGGTRAWVGSARAGALGLHDALGVKHVGHSDLQGETGRIRNQWPQAVMTMLPWTLEYVSRTRE